MAGYASAGCNVRRTDHSVGQRTS